LETLIQEKKEEEKRTVRCHLSRHQSFPVILRGPMCIRLPLFVGSHQHPLKPDSERSLASLWMWPSAVETSHPEFGEEERMKKGRKEERKHKKNILKINTTSTALMVAPCSTKYFTRSRLPLSTAICKALIPRKVAVFGDNLF
jgi:hypothetical protein